MIFDLNTLTKDELQECRELAILRTEEQVDDANNGMRAASCSHGRYAPVNARTYEERLEDSLMGAIAELIGSKLAHCKWKKVMGQYKGNKEPDLSPKFQGKIVPCDVRGTRKYNSFIFRERDFRNADGLLIAVTNLPEGPECQVGHAFFRDIKKIVNDYPEFMGNHSGSPYYRIPFKFISGDFADFEKYEPYS